MVQAEADRRHVGNLQLGHIGDVLHNGLRDYQVERDSMLRWAQTDVNLQAIGRWADQDLRRLWGFKAAARAFHIAQCGEDASIRAPFKGRTPTDANVQPAGPVPGAPSEAGNLFDVSQILAWLAKERRDLQEQVEWRTQIPALMAALEARAWGRNRLTWRTRSKLTPCPTLASIDLESRNHMAAEWIVSDPEILAGKPCVRGTRLSVEFLLELAASGATQADILVAYPQLTAEALSAAFSFAAQTLKHDRTIDIPQPA